MSDPVAPTMRATRARALIAAYLARPTPEGRTAYRRDSADAAALDLLLSALFDLRLSVEDLAAVAREVGAELPSNGAELRQHWTAQGILTRLRRCVAYRRGIELERRTRCAK